MAGFKPARTKFFRELRALRGEQCLVRERTPRLISRAKTPRTPSSENIFFFAAFAPLREIFRFLVAALPR